MPRPPKNTERLEVRVPPQIMQGIANMRRDLEDIPPVAEVVRMLLEDGLRQRGYLQEDTHNSE